jgi:hypothetical protein
MDSGVEETKGNHHNGYGDDELMDVCDAGPSYADEETPELKRSRAPGTLLGDDVDRAARRLRLSVEALSLVPREAERPLLALREPSKSAHGRHGDESDEEDSEGDEEGDEDDEEEGGEGDEEEEETEEVRQVLGESIVHRQHKQINREGECAASSNHTGQVSVKPLQLE